MKKAILILIILGLLAGGGAVVWRELNKLCCAPPPNGNSETPASGVTEATVEGSEYSFSPATITVEEGKTVKLTFKNVGNTIHTWTIDELSASTGSILPGSSKTIEFDAVGAGTYEIYCSVSGHKESGMVGVLIVE
jgi:plastocyanin